MALLTNYLARVQPHAIDTLVRVQFDASTHDVMLDLVTIKNLEILQSQYDSSRQHSLLGVIDTTACALGARLLREILTHPTQDMTLLQTRQTQISAYLQRSADAKRTHEILRHMLDLPKIVATILYKKSTPIVL
jgi:DNA mismatch repair protein MutS